MVSLVNSTEHSQNYAAQVLSGGKVHSQIHYFYSLLIYIFIHLGGWGHNWKDKILNILLCL